MRKMIFHPLQNSRLLLSRGDHEIRRRRFPDEHAIVLEAPVLIEHSGGYDVAGLDVDVVGAQELQVIDHGLRGIALD